MAKYLDATGITTLWNKSKDYFLSRGGGSMSTTSLIGNLNADLLDGYHEASFFRYRGELYQNNNHNADTLGIGSWIFRGTGYGNVGTGAAHANALDENSTIEVFSNLQLSVSAWSNTVAYRVKWGGETNPSTRPNGWSNWYQFLSSENYTSYTVKKDGTGATGTWGINVTGSAGSVAWTNVSGKPSTFMPSDHSHPYLPLSGGTILEQTEHSFVLQRNHSTYGAYIKFTNNSGNYGWIGFDAANEPVFANTSWSFYPLLHSGNWGSYIGTSSSPVSYAINDADGHDIRSMYLPRYEVSIEQTDSWGKTYAETHRQSLVYNTHGREWAYWIGMRSSGINYGTILRLSHDGLVQYAHKAGGGAGENWSNWKDIITSDNISSQSVGSSTTSNRLAITGYGDSCLTYYQAAAEFDGNSGWTHYIIANHGDGETYYHYTIGLPFWSVPKYRRQEGSTSNTTQWYSFITEENIANQSVYYATNADTVDGYHASSFSLCHNSSWNYNESHSSNWVTFDAHQATGAPSSSWYNGFVTTHSNYLSSYIVNEHRTHNWYVGWNQNEEECRWSKLLTSSDSYVSSEGVGYINGSQITYASSAGSVAWGNVSGKPSEFTPSSGSSYYVERLNWWNDSDSHNVDSLLSGTTFAYSAHNAPTTGTVVAFNCRNSTGYPLQLQGEYYGESLWFRNKNGDSGTWNTWRYVIHSGNIGSQSVNYANSAGSVAWGNITDKPSSYTPSSHTHDYIPRYSSVSNYDTWNDSDWGFSEWAGPTSSTGAPTYYGTSFNFRDATTWYFRLMFGTDNRIYYRNGINTTTLSAIGTIAYTSDFASASVNYANSAGSASSVPSLSNSEIDNIIV